MRPFLKKLGAFLLFSFAVSAVLLLGIVVANQRAVSGCELGDGVDTVIVGDSHAMWSIDSGQIEHLDNISLNAEGYVYTYDKLLVLLEKEPGVRHVYLAFGYHNLSGYFDDYIHGARFTEIIDRYVGVMSTKDFVDVALHSPASIPAMFRQVLQGGGKSALKQRCTLYGSFPDEKMTKTYDSEQMKKRIAAQYFGDDGQLLGVSESNVEYLEKIVSLLKRNDIRVTLLNTPLHSDYARMVPESYKKLYYDYVEQFQVGLYEFGDLVLTDSDFLPDGDHVNYQGAMRVTQKFKEYHESVDE